VATGDIHFITKNKNFSMCYYFPRKIFWMGGGGEGVYVPCVVDVLVPAAAVRGEAGGDEDKVRLLVQLG
jgi:hypothetical protein